MQPVEGLKLRLNRNCGPGGLRLSWLRRLKCLYYDISNIAFHAVCNDAICECKTKVSYKSSSFLTKERIDYVLGVDRYVFFRADADTDYYRSSRPITDILNRYTFLV